MQVSGRGNEVLAIEDHVTDVTAGSRGLACPRLGVGRGENQAIVTADHAGSVAIGDGSKSGVCARRLFLPALPRFRSEDRAARTNRNEPVAGIRHAVKHLLGGAVMEVPGTAVGRRQDDNHRRE